MITFTITRFIKPGGSETFHGTEAISSEQDLQNLIDNQSSKKNQPHFWSAGLFHDAATAASHKVSTALTLEYQEAADHIAINKIIRQLGFLCYFVETKRGIAYIFPLTADIERGLYTRLCSALAEEIGQGGLVTGAANASNLFYVPKAAQVATIQGQAINPKDYQFETTDLNEPVATWYDLKPAPTISETYISQDRARLEIKTQKTASQFDDLFEKSEAALETVAILHQAIAEARRAQGGQA